MARTERVVNPATQVMQENAVLMVKMVPLVRMLLMELLDLRE